MVTRAQEKANVSDEEFEHEFNRTAGTQAKTWVFATHFMAFVLFWIVAGGLPLNLGLLAAGVSGAARDQLVSLGLIVGLFAYLLIALHRSYGDRWYAAAPRAFVMVIASVPMLRVYRLLLFFVTLYTMH